MSNISIGDAIISSLVVSSPRGSLDLTNSFVEASIYESIFTPGVVCDVSVLDTQDLIGELKISGDETVKFRFKSPNMKEANFTLALYELGEQQQLASQKAKTYVLKCVSEEAMFAKTNTVQKSYNTLCSDIIKDLCKTYLQSKKRLEVETTKGSQNILIPSKSPFNAINMVRARSVSAENNRSSSYVFFETRENSEQILRFCTLESRFATPVVKKFEQQGAININFLNNDQDNNILSFSIPKQFSSIDKIATSGKTRISTFNFTTWDYESKDVKTSEQDYKDGGSGKYVSDAFANRYFNSRIPPQSFVPVDISQRAATHIAEATSDFNAYISQVMQNSLKIRVPGDTDLTSGVMIDCDIPNHSATTGPVKKDPMMSGKYLIARIHHKIGMAQEKPRYTCIIEGLKGRYEEGL